jgi:hypothetical protein
VEDEIKDTVDEHSEYAGCRADRHCTPKIVLPAYISDYGPNEEK